MTHMILAYALVAPVTCWVTVKPSKEMDLGFILTVASNHKIKNNKKPVRITFSRETLTVVASQELSSDVAN